MKKSNHAMKRCQQRGIRDRQVELILKHGIIEQKRGAYECYIPKQIFVQVISDYKRKIQDLENISRSNKTLLLNQGTIITAYNKEKF